MTISQHALAANNNKDTISVAVIGGAGYVGSALIRHLRTNTAWSVEGFDRNARAPKLHNTNIASYDIPISLLHTFDAIVYLGGFTGRKVCDLHTDEQVFKENVQDVLVFAQRMLPTQLLVVASTAALGEGQQMFTEKDTVQEQLLDRYTWSMLQRENTLRSSSLPPQIICVRFGTVVGVSPSQRTEFVHVGMVRSAFVDSIVKVVHSETHRAVLWIQDQVRALQTLIEQRHRVADTQFDVFHLVSFNSRIEAIANAVAAHTGVRAQFVHLPTELDNVGFSVSNAKFCATFNFTFEGTQQKVIQQLIDNIDHVIVGRELLDNEEKRSVPCRVCGSTDLMTVLDLSNQPLANDFRNSAEQALHQCKRFPLRLMRCRKCHHTQLSHMVDRESLFSTYAYRSGTSRTLKAYFEWLAELVIRDSSLVESNGNGTVLELACNDGTQLDVFADRGWKTYGIDPAQNIAAITKQKGQGRHSIQVGFWGASAEQQAVLDANLPPAGVFNAIVAQNVLAHVPDPVSFLKACVAHMSASTRLYIQTSQCEMFDTGQFDTVYHEHISFFTAHSFQKLGERVGLEVVAFQITPIHGRSCLVTYMLKQAPSMSLQQYAFTQALHAEQERGMTQDAFYVRYRGRALQMRSWMHEQLTMLHRLQSYQLVAYGAAAKGMVLLHFLREIDPREYEFAYVVDDAPQKQNMFCPGTSIPVKPTSELAKHNDSLSGTLAVVVFAWNFWDEIEANIVRTLNPTQVQRVLILLPFPQQQLLVLNIATGATTPLLSNPSLQWKQHQRKQRVVLITHFYNEEMLLPYFIRHHASMFDVVVLIDNGSTDKSAQIIRELAPSSWTVVKSHTEMFAADKIDREVRDYEELFPNDWKITLTITEFLVHPNLRKELETASSASMILRFRAFEMVGADGAQPLQRFPHLLQQRSVYSVGQQDRNGLGHYSRFIHRLPTSLPYAPGRHALSESLPVQVAEHGFVAKLLWTPWPESMQRKLQIRARIPPHHLAAGWGVQHNTDAVGLIAKRQQHLSSTQAFDLRHVFVSKPEGFSVEMADAHQMWRETFGCSGCVVVH